MLRPFSRPLEEAHARDVRCRGRTHRTNRHHSESATRQGGPAITRGQSTFDAFRGHGAQRAHCHQPATGLCGGARVSGGNAIDAAVTAAAVLSSSTDDERHRRLFLWCTRRPRPCTRQPRAPYYPEDSETQPHRDSYRGVLRRRPRHCRLLSRNTARSSSAPQPAIGYARRVRGERHRFGGRAILARDRRGDVLPTGRAKGRRHLQNRGWQRRSRHRARQP